jgi:hypothetical protein
MPMPGTLSEDSSTDLDVQTVQDLEGILFDDSESDESDTDFTCRQTDVTVITPITVASPANSGASRASSSKNPTLRRPDVQMESLPQTDIAAPVAAPVTQAIASPANSAVSRVSSETPSLRRLEAIERASSKTPTHQTGPDKIGVASPFQVDPSTRVVHEGTQSTIFIPTDIDITMGILDTHVVPQSSMVWPRSGSLDSQSDSESGYKAKVSHSSYGSQGSLTWCYCRTSLPKSAAMARSIIPSPFVKNSMRRQKSSVN